jgi:hypothetical protein
MGGGMVGVENACADDGSEVLTCVQRRELLLQVASVCVKRPLHVVLE